MQTEQVEYRRVKLPRTDMFFFACWFDENERLDVFVQFTEAAPALKLAELLESIGYKALVHNEDWLHPEIIEADHVSEYFETMITFEEPLEAIALWASGKVVSEDEVVKFQSIDELSR